jgi:fatty acid desaturase
LHQANDHQEGTVADSIRETYSVFPRWSQPLWTLFTGKPAAGEQPLFVPTGWLYLAVALAVFICGTLGSYSLVQGGLGLRLWGLLPTMMLTLMGSRLLILTIAHQCAHLRFCNSRRLNRVVHDVLTTIICSQNYDSYRDDHIHLHHRTRTFGTFEDPVLSFIKRLGFVSDLTRAQLWRKLARTCISPLFHGTYLMNRLRQNIFAGRIGRRCFAVVWWSGLVILLVLRPQSIVPVLVAYAIPILILYNVSAFLELICEHVWMRSSTAPAGRERIVDLSWGRFCGDVVPTEEHFCHWIRWWLRMLFYHLPCRLLVLAGDAPQHDFHHMAPSGRRWTVSAYERRDRIEEGKMGDCEVWGLFEAIDIVFGNFSTIREHRSTGSKYGEMR